MNKNKMTKFDLVVCLKSNNIKFKKKYIYIMFYMIISVLYKIFRK